MLSEETVQPRDLQMMGLLVPLGIEKGKEFKPEAKTTALLKKASEEAHAWLIDKATTDVTPWWPGSQWVVPTPPITMPTEQMGDAQLFWRGCASHRSLAIFLSNGKAGHRQFLLRRLSRQQRHTSGGREHLPAARSAECSSARVLVYHRL